MNGNEAVAQYLLDNGADPNTANRLGETPLFYVASNSMFELAELLFEFHADPNIANHEGETPLCQAAYRGDLMMLELLLEHKADPNQTCKYLGRSSLHYAVMGGHLTCVLLLLNFGASLALRDASGLTALDLATPELEQAIAGYSRPPPKKLQLSVIEEVVTEEDRSPEPTCSKVAQLLFHETGEPDCEVSNVRRSDLCGLFEFLARLKLQEHFDRLAAAGFDDISSLISQMNTPVPIDAEMLEHLGIVKPGHRRRLLFGLHQATPRPRPRTLQCCGLLAVAKKPRRLADTLEEWLAELKMQKHLKRFLAAGYEDVTSMRALMHSEYAISEEVLRTEVGVEKPGHRYRILAKLLAEAGPSQVFEGNTCSLL